jgi:hypothetical protein
MKKAEIVQKFTGSLRKAGFRLAKHSPEILLAAGVVGVIASAVLACKATTKVGAILDKAKTDVDVIHDFAANESEKEYTREDSVKDLAIVYVHTGVELAKLYGPALALGALSLGGILASNNILRKRNVALSAAFAAVSAGFKEYRSRVALRYGEEVDRELRHNIVAKKIDKVIIDENGKEKKVKETVGVIGDIDGHSEYARFFDSSSPAWEKEPAYNKRFLSIQQQFANDLLRSNGILFLNEVYNLLGLPKSKTGQIVGWVYNPDDPKGDNYVDFGLYEAYKERNTDLDEYNPALLLDFNVDGNVWDLM